MVAAVAVLAGLVKPGRRITATWLGLARILGGALRNAYDRLRRGEAAELDLDGIWDISLPMILTLPTNGQVSYSTH